MRRKSGPDGDVDLEEHERLYWHYRHRLLCAALPFSSRDSSLPRSLALVRKQPRPPRDRLAHLDLDAPFAAHIEQDGAAKLAELCGARRARDAQALEVRERARRGRRGRGGGERGGGGGRDEARDDERGDVCEVVVELELEGAQARRARQRVEDLCEVDGEMALEVFEAGEEGEVGDEGGRGAVLEREADERGRDRGEGAHEGRVRGRGRAREESEGREGVA